MNNSEFNYYQPQGTGNESYSNFDSPLRPEPPTSKAVKAMVFGIISIMLSEFPILSIVGIIFGALAKKWAAPIRENFPHTSARLFANAGKITGSIGLGISIGFTIFWSIYIPLIVLGIMMSGDVTVTETTVAFNAIFSIFH